MKTLIVVCVFLMMTNLSWAQTPSIGQVGRSQDILNNQDRFQRQITTPRKVLIRSVVIEGFTIKDHGELDQMLSSYHNKRVEPADIDGIVDQVKAYYSQAGYDGLVEFSHKLKRGKLIITATLINR